VGGGGEKKDQRAFGGDGKGKVYSYGVRKCKRGRQLDSGGEKNVGKEELRVGV